MNSTVILALICFVLGFVVGNKGIRDKIVEMIKNANKKPAKKTTKPKSKNGG